MNFEERNYDFFYNGFGYKFKSLDDCEEFCSSFDEYLVCNNMKPKNYKKDTIISIYNHTKSKSVLTLNGNCTLLYRNADTNIFKYYESNPYTVDLI